MKTNNYFNRLQFFDKAGYDRAFLEFKPQDDDNVEGNSFLSYLLDSGTDFEPISVRNAINFARSWVELKRPLSQRILTRILYLCFLDTSFINQLVFIADILENNNWVFHALSKILKVDFERMVDSIKTNHPIWTFLYDILLSDAKSKESACLTKYCDRGSSFLIEAFPLFWPSDNKSFVTMDSLCEAFFDFLIEIGSDTCYSLMNILAFAFPQVVAKIPKDRLYRLSSDAIFHLYKHHCIKLPEKDSNNGAILATKIFPFNHELALSLAESDTQAKDKGVIIEMIKRYNPEEKMISIHQ